MGVSEISSFVLASWLSAAVIRLDAVTMPHAVLATMRPPAIIRTGKEIPKKLSTKRPRNMKKIRMTVT